jgi:hypothetical protein
MRRLLLLAACAAAIAGCVSVEGAPDPHGALKPGQRVVVVVYPSPGPWIIGAADTKAEAAAKISPLGYFVQTAENQHTLSVSKNLQQYLPRPRLGQAVQDSILTALRAARSTDTVQTAMEAQIATSQLAEWNKSKDQLDWRQRYYSPDPTEPAPRDYAKVLTLDDALILDVNVSFGTDASDDGRLLPTISAASRVYSGDTAHLLWEHEEIVTDQASSATMTDIQVQPWTLTDDLQKLAPALGTAVAASFLKAVTVVASTTSTHVEHKMAPTPSGGGLVSMSLFENLSTAAPAGIQPPTPAPPAAAPTAPPAAMPAAPTPVTPPSVTPSTTAASGLPTPPAAMALPGMSGATAPPATSTPTAAAPIDAGASTAAVAAPASTPPAVSISTSPPH